jgi:multicomponent Na+:H+ antiporter subunit G
MGWSLDLLKVLFIGILVLATNPTATHAMAKAALHGGMRPMAEKPVSKA